MSWKRLRQTLHSNVCIHRWGITHYHRKLMKKSFLSPFKLVLLVLTLGSLLCVEVSFGQEVTRHSDEASSLEGRWAWAESEGARVQEKGYWVGYSIDKLMWEQSFIGSFGSRRSNKTLYEILGEPEKIIDRTAWGMSNGYKRSAHHEGRLLLKEIAILFYVDKSGKKEPSNPSEIKVSNLSLEVDLKRKPLIWLGAVEQDESIFHLTELYDDIKSSDLKEDVISALGLHTSARQILAFMEKVLETENDDDLKEAAVFWIGQQDLPESLEILKRVLASGWPADVREKAVFSISQMSLPEATETLIDLARNEPNREIRKNAIFWLGQKASRQAMEVLNEVLLDEGDVEVQKQAVFAVSQFPKDEAVPRLIEIAKNHQSTAVRKQAIFWLGDSGDPRALEVLIELARQNE